MSTQRSPLLELESSSGEQLAPYAAPPKRTGMSRRSAIPAIGLVLIAGSTLAGCELFTDALEVDPTEEAARLRAALAAAQEHRGGIQRFALQHLVDNIAVHVEDESSHGKPDRLIVTIYERDPAGGFVMQGNKRKVLEVHRNLTNATISQIESDYVLFYYLYPN